ncbi:MAG: uL22 family ribosomal protein [Candidatus Karelsulcia muelleri]
MFNNLYYKSNNINYSQIKLIKLINILKYKNLEYIINFLGKIKNKGAICLKQIILNAYNQNCSKIESQPKNVYIKNIIINKSIRFKKIRPAPQGRVNKIKKQFVKMILILKTSDGTKG